MNILYDIYHVFFPIKLSYFDIHTTKNDDILVVVSDQNYILIEDIMYSINLKNGQRHFVDGLVITDDDRIYGSFIPSKLISSDIKRYDFFTKSSNPNDIKFYIKDLSISPVSIWTQISNLLQLHVLDLEDYKFSKFISGKAPDYIFLPFSKVSIDFIMENFKGLLNSSYINNTNSDNYLVIDTKRSKVLAYKYKQHEDFTICHPDKWVNSPR